MCVLSFLPCLRGDGYTEVHPMVGRRVFSHRRQHAVSLPTIDEDDEYQ